ncbi:hypothetical protein FOZ63_013577, partial [Perkinsus olseni]
MRAGSSSSRKASSSLGGSSSQGPSKRAITEVKGRKISSARRKSSGGSAQPGVSASAGQSELQRRVEALGEEISILRQQAAEKERTLREISSYYDEELNVQAEQHRAELGRFDLVVELAKRDAIKDAERDAQIGSEKLRMSLNDLQNRLQLQTIELLRRTHEHEYSVRLHRDKVGSLRRLLAHTATRQREQLESLKESMKLEQKSEMKRYKEGFLRKATTELRGGLDQADVKMK